MMAREIVIAEQIPDRVGFRAAAYVYPKLRPVWVGPRRGAELAAEKDAQIRRNKSNER